MIRAHLGPFAIGQVPQPGAKTVDDTLNEIFTRPEFAPPEPAAWERWIKELLTSFAAWLAGLHGRSPALFWVLLVGCVVLLLLLLTHIIWTLHRVWYASARPLRESAAKERRRLSQRFRAEADLHAAAGDYTEAIRCLFLALVYRFDESGRIDFRSAYTNREYLALCAGRPDVQAGLREFVDTLDENWYGQHPSAPGQFERSRALYDELTTSLPATTREST
jgi:hypothetical protein